MCVNYYFRQAPIFNDFCSQFCQFYFCNKFCLIFHVYFQYLFMHVVCANIFGANVLKSRFKIDVVIMVICSIVIIINSVLTLPFLILLLVTAIVFMSFSLIFKR
jgi:hypothetical protein